MAVVAQIGTFTSLLELVATVIGAGVVVGGFLIAATQTLLAGRWLKELKRDPLKDVFWGGLIGTFCLCIDLIMRGVEWL
jgi:hypothetical protein